ncbi:MAG: thiolase domain-containing protein [Myxococcota bacterium]|nr:thiolase domain-containing protein [Myxococcota bacterium]
MSRPCAVIGVGQTRYAAKRQDKSIAGLIREAVDAAMLEAGVEWGDIDAVVLGKAPDFFEGIMMPEHHLASALGAVGKPLLRVHTAGSVGGSTAVVGAHLIQSGVHERVLCCAFEVQSCSNAMWALSPTYPFQPPTVAGAGGYFAPLIRAYIRRAKAPHDVGWKVVIKDRRNALKNPLAHLHSEPTLEQCAQAPVLWDPINYLETCPSSDGACAMVLSSEPAAKRAPQKPAFVQGTSLRSEPIFFPGRDQVSPQAGRDCAADVFAQAQIRNPLDELDMAELYVPFSWFEPMWLENLGFAAPGEGWRLVEDGVTDFGGALPTNVSGGVLSSNPIGASGMIRFAEAARQVRGLAGAHQVEGCRRAVGHAYGGGSQFFAMWVVGETPMAG